MAPTAVGAQQPAQPEETRTEQAPSPKGDDTGPAAPTAPPRTVGGAGAPKRRILSIWSGVDGFRYAAMHPRTDGRWQAAYASEYKQWIVEIWESEGGGRCIGTYAEMCRGLRDGTLHLGVLDLVVMTPPCTDYASVNDERQGVEGEAGKFFAEIPELIRLLRQRHVVKAWVIEEVLEAADEPALVHPEHGIIATLQRTNHQVAVGEVHMHTVGVPSTRRRLGVVACHAPHMRQGGPIRIPGAKEHGEPERPAPVLQPFLQRSDEVSASLRESPGSLVKLPPGAAQVFWPAHQVGSLRGNGPGRSVFDPKRGTAGTLRANVKRAKGPGGVTTLILDDIGPRRLSPTEALRMHGFPEHLATRLSDAQVYKIVGNAVPVQWAIEVLNMLHARLR